MKYAALESIVNLNMYFNIKIYQHLLPLSLNITREKDIRVCMRSVIKRQACIVLNSIGILCHC